MNEIKLKVNFGKRTCVKSGISLTTGDYNSTKIKFEFDREDGTKIFEMKNPNDEVIFVDEIVNNEVILVGQADVTTKHNDVTYIKYTDDNDIVYWYDNELEKLYNTSFVEVQNVSIDNLTKVTENASLFTMAGRYVFEISLYDGDSKLTSKSDYLDIKEEQVIINDNMVSLYLPVFDRLMSEIETLDIDVNKSGTTSTVTLTKKDGTTKEVEILDGERGPQGIQGIQGIQGVKGDNATINGVNTLNIVAGTNINLSQSGSTLTISTDTEENVQSDWNQADSTKDDYIKNKPTKLSDFTDDLGSNPTHTHSQYLTEHQDISMKQNIEDNTLNTNNKTVPSAINEVNSIAKGANQALSYSNYQSMITAFNNLANNVYNVGQNVMIVTLEVPDLWISGIESTSSTYTYTTDSAFTTELATNGYVQVGYYKLSALETQKVDLTNYVQFTDYASTTKAGVVKARSIYGLNMNNEGELTGFTRNYSSYQTDSNALIINKGTLENVITGKDLTTKSYVDGLVGDIATALDTIQGEVI